MVFNVGLITSSDNQVKIFSVKFLSLIHQPNTQATRVVCL